MTKMTVVKIGLETNCHHAKWILLEFFFFSKNIEKPSLHKLCAWCLRPICNHEKNHVSRNFMQHFILYSGDSCFVAEPVVNVILLVCTITIKLNVFESMHVIYFYLVTLNVWYLKLVHCNSKHYFWNAYYDGIINIT